jgi:hypothetical protein
VGVAIGGGLVSLGWAMSESTPEGAHAPRQTSLGEINECKTNTYFNWWTALLVGASLGRLHQIKTDT